MKRFWTIGAALLVALLVVGCGFAPATNTDKGSIVLLLNNSMARSMLPPISMEIDHYLVSGTGPNGDSFGPMPVDAEQSATIEELTPGDWNVIAVGRNASGNAIAAGSGTCKVIVGQSVPCTIQVVEYFEDSEGNPLFGSFLLDIAWEPDVVGDPIWVGSLKDSATPTPVVTAMSFTTTESTCTSQSLTESLHPGWFTMIAQIFDAPDGLTGSEVLVSGRAEAVRIAAERQTHGDIWVHVVGGQGQIELVLSADMHDEIGLTAEPGFSDLTSLGIPPNNEATWVQVYADQVVNFEATPSEAATLVYYFQGQQVAVDPISGYDMDTGSLTLDEHYVLDVVAFSIDGQRAGSASWIVKMNDIAAEQLDIVASLNSVLSAGCWGFNLYADDGVTVVDSYYLFENPCVGSKSHTFAALPAGDYYLQGFFEPDSTPTLPYQWYEWWEGAANVSEATPIVIPHAPGEVYDLGGLDY